VDSITDNCNCVIFCGQSRGIISLLCVMFLSTKAQALRKVK